MSNEMVVREHNNFLESLDDMERVAQSIVKSGLFNLKTADQVIALGMIAQAEGRPFVSAVMEYDVVQGRPALRAQAALARFQRSGGKVEWLERNDKKVSARFSHPASSPLVVTWDIARAQAMALAGKDNWRKQPQVMLTWRCVAEGVRATFPACLGMMYLDAEVQDFDGPKDVTQQVQVTPPATSTAAIDDAKKKVKAAAPKKATEPAKVEQPAPEVKPPAAQEPPAKVEEPAAPPPKEAAPWKTKFVLAWNKKFTDAGLSAITQTDMEAWIGKPMEAWTDTDREQYLKMFKDTALDLAEIRTFIADVQKKPEAPAEDVQGELLK